MPFSTPRRISALTGVLFLLGSGAAHAATQPAGFVPFAPDSIWNLPLRDDAPLASNSAGYVSFLTQSVATSGAWLNTTSCGMPEYWADANTPTVPVTLNHPSYEDPALIRAWSAVPIPADAQPANCSDQNFAVLQQQPNGNIKEWEFWKATHNANGSWTAEWGGAMNNVLTDRGIASPLEWTDPSAPTPAARQSTYEWNVTTSGISMLAGVITNSDLAAGQINHAVAMAIPTAAASNWMWPAQRSDGSSTNPNALPEGAHLRLSPALTIPSLHLAPIVAMIAEAAQKYGIVVRDVTYSSTVFYAEQPYPGQENAVTALLAGQSMSRALAAFPWSQLQVLAAPICTDGSDCSATPRAVINVGPDLTVGSTVTLDTSNSTLNYPRSHVQWDLTGNGSYSMPGRTGVSTTLPLTTAGPHTIGVRITTADGTVVTGTTSFVVAAASAAAGLASTTLTTSSLASPGTSSSPLTPAPSQAMGTPLGTRPSTSTAKPVFTSAVGTRPPARPAAQTQASSAGRRKTSPEWKHRTVRRSRRSPGRRCATSRRLGRSGPKRLSACAAR